ncbi:MAG: HesA/MoeB/ThiF family protein [Oscillospiraceae bacterium]|nr:HesA/MoeB/ThiF family protein [Oscillospiraceae bacterium]
MTTDLYERYDRQLLIPEIGVTGQKKLLDSSILVVGAGGLGSPVLFYLAAAGVGKIHIIDHDVVSLSNLNRQILYSDAEIGKDKAFIAVQKIKNVNPSIAVSGQTVKVTSLNASEITTGYDCIVPCLDSIETRKVINRAAVKHGIPYVEGAVSAFHGSLMTVIPGLTPCYECIFTHVAQPESPIPVLGAMAGLVGSMMALAVVRLLLHIADPSAGALVFIDGKTYENTVLPIARDPNCPVCSKANPL